VTEQKELAKQRLVLWLEREGPLQFSQITDLLLQTFMLRETNVKDICLELQREGKVANTWGGGNRKPNDTSLIELSDR
jgi:hypothetical protein